MPIVGPLPETGLRITVERATDRDEGPPWRYAGHVATPIVEHALTAAIASDGTVEVRLEGVDPAVAGLRGGLTERARLLLRAAWKHAHEEGAPPPRRIVRWRADG